MLRNSEPAACCHQTQLMICFKAYLRVIVIPFHRSPCKRYMQYFYQQFRLCHRDNYGESSGILADFCPAQCVNVLSVPQPAGPPVNVTCNIFINSFGSIAETTMVSVCAQTCSKALISALELILNHPVFVCLFYLTFLLLSLLCFLHKNAFLKLFFLPSRSLLVDP